MKDITVTLYTAEELKSANPEAFEKAFERFQSQQDEIFWTDETIESLKETFKHSNIDLEDYNLDAAYPTHSFIRFDMDNDVYDLSGVRAQAWLENNLLSDLRIPFSGPRRWEVAKYGSYYRPGMIKPCPFTGYCADEDFLESLQNDIKAGKCLGDAYKNLAHVAGTLLSNELEYQTSEEHFLEQDFQYTIDGRLWRGN